MVTPKKIFLTAGCFLISFLLARIGPAGEMGISVEQNPGTGTAASYLFHGDTEGILIEHRSAQYSCCLELVPRVELEMESLGGKMVNALRITETDQGPPCLCPVIFYDLQIRLTGLPPDSYHVFLNGEDGSVLATGKVIVPGTRTLTFVRGQINDDEEVDVSDVIALLNHLYLGGTIRPPCLDAADVNDDGARDVSDAVHLLGYLFLGDEEPKPPFPEPAEDPTVDDIVCTSENSVTARNFRRGDVDGNGAVELTDGIRILTFLSGGYIELPCEDAADYDDDGVVSKYDAILITTPCPFPFEIPCESPVYGPDLTPDSLGCNAYPEF